VLGLQRTLPGSAYAPLADALPLLRAIKDDAELDRLAAAGEEVDECFAEIVRVPFAGRPEAELAAELAGLLRAHGHSHVSFTVVGSGPNGASPHHEVSDRTIEDGDMVVLDFGGVRDGYCSDITRTVHVGEPTEEEREVYEVVRAAQQAGLEAVAPGVPCEEVDRAARAVIAAAGYGEAFIHRTGHGIGLAGQEPPYLVAGETLPLEPRMCFSVEPGIYLPGRFGVRIEDIVAVTGDGRRRLNNAARELQLVA
jgi:D-alanyl-D-alanine dipeptidase